MRTVFIHGAGCTDDVFAAQLDAFDDADAIVLPGRRGEATGPSTIAEFADAVERQLGARSAGDVVLCGHSMGGAIALELGLRDRGSVRGIVLIDSGAKLRVAPALFESLERDFSAGARALARMFFADPLPDRVEFATGVMLEVGQAQTLRDFHACNAFDASERLGELRVPLLALTGKDDRLTPPKFAQFLADRIPGASARILEGAGHFAMVERPDETNALIAAFVAETKHR
ncbi:MAG: alpha/beta fold hydrolase [Candidatus Tumulicola sp.]